MAAQQTMIAGIKDGTLQDAEPLCKVVHHFTPRDPKFGCFTYAREAHAPKGTVVVGKLHKHAHINIILQGRVSVVTESGPVEYTAPCIFVSPAGTKRVLRVEEDVVWATIHTVSSDGEVNLPSIERETIAESYDALLKLGEPTPT